MEKYFEMLSWWQLPLSAIGNELIVLLSCSAGLILTFGLLSYIFKIL